jgi:hypothetical protein
VLAGIEAAFATSVTGPFVGEAELKRAAVSPAEIPRVAAHRAAEHAVQPERVIVAV